MFHEWALSIHRFSVRAANANDASGWSHMCFCGQRASGGAFRTLSSGLNLKGTASHKAVLCPLGGGAIALAYMSRSLQPPVSLGGCVFRPFVKQWLLLGSTCLMFQGRPWVVRFYRVQTGTISPFLLASTSSINFGYTGGTISHGKILGNYCEERLLV